MFKNLFYSTQPLEKGLDGVWLRNQVITNNIANVDTPNFKSSYVEFETVFRSALQQAGMNNRGGPNPKRAAIEMSRASPRVHENRNTIMGINGNNVDIDGENAKLAKNNIHYNILINKIKGELAKLHMAISEGR